MALTDTRIRTEKPGDKPRKLADGGGLYLLINTSGKYWRWKYRFDGKEKVMAFGVYPAVTLAQARQGHKEARAILDGGAWQNHGRIRAHDFTSASGIWITTDRGHQI